MCMLYVSVHFCRRFGYKERPLRCSGGMGGRGVAWLLYILHMSGTPLKVYEYIIFPIAVLPYMCFYRGCRLLCTCRAPWALRY